MKEGKNIGSILGTIGAVTLILFVSGFMVFAVTMIITTETITVEGKVTHVEAYDDFMVVIFDDGRKYKIRYPGDNIDLTVNSSLIMRLTDYNPFFIDDGIWNEVSITKVPSED